ncbi:hypothetical protein KR038_009962 [Drosophila bunnanda]|nr:hypothetical protein KR038_009962 [Drosophila bunnanda]
MDERGGGGAGGGAAGGSGGSTTTGNNKSAAASSAAAPVDKPTVLEGVLHNIFDGLTDKEEQVRGAMQQAIVKILETHPERAAEILCDYRAQQPKMSEQTVAMLLDCIRRVVGAETPLPSSANQKLIALALQELTRSPEHVPLIQNPAQRILVAIGRSSPESCAQVMEALQEKKGPNPDGSGVPHFMLMQSLGLLATENPAGVVPHIKAILSRCQPHLGGIRQDHIKQAHAYAIGRFSEALLEEGGKTEDEDGEEKRCSTEISVAYDVLFNQWLHSREPKVCVEILQALSSMYPLLPRDRIQDQAARLVPQILALYRRSVDRNAVTQFLCSVLKTNLALNAQVLDGIIDTLITPLFDLLCVYPDYEKPQTVKGHYEVLRCFHLLAGHRPYSARIMDTLLIHLRNNSERERMKSLLILTHLLNSCAGNIENRIPALIECLKQLILSERGIKMKLTLLKTIVALAQKSHIRDKEFVWFVVRHSCRYSKPSQEYGSPEEHSNLALSCENTLYMLASTVGTLDELLKRELLNYFILLDYTDICGNLAKCLASLFAKSPHIEYDIATGEDDVSTDNNAAAEGAAAGVEDRGVSSVVKRGKVMVPGAETIYARCLALLGNQGHCIKRCSNILSFLRYYHPQVNPALEELWERRIPDLQLQINRESAYRQQLHDFVLETNEFLGGLDENFAQRLASKLADQMYLYPIQLPHSEWHLPADLSAERGMLLQAVALTLLQVTDVACIHTKIDLIVTSARQERLDKHVKHADYEKRIEPCARALGYISRQHLGLLVKKLTELAQVGGRKHSTGFFSNLHFIKDTHKELENYKSNLLVVKSFGRIMEEADPLQSLQHLDEDDTLLGFLMQQLAGHKDQTIMSAILQTLLSICNQLIATKEQLTSPLRHRKQIMETVFSIPIEAPFHDLPLLPTILKLGTDFIRIGGPDTEECVDGGVIFEIACRNFFGCAQQLKMKFDSQEEDERNSFLAKHLNESLPQLNALVRVIVELDASPATLDLIIGILETWTRDRNSEVRICASHVFNNTLEVYIKAMRIGCEAPSKFNQTGQMLGKIVPRCIDSNGTVRQVSVEILQKTLEIACIYETLTIASIDSNADWLKEIEAIKEHIITDEPKQIYNLAGDIAKIIALRISSFQYLQFCKTLLQSLRDPEQSSTIGASVVLKFFIQQKGSELFHAIPDLVRDSLLALQVCEVPRAKSGVLKALVALTKHHPKLVCAEMLNQPLPYDPHLVEYWHLVCNDPELTGLMLDIFLQLLSGAALQEGGGGQEAGTTERQKLASSQPFAIFCALHEMLPCKDIKGQLEARFADMFSMLLTSLSSYTNLAPPNATNASISPNQTQPTGKSKFGFVPNKELIKLNPCQIALETFQAFLTNLEMEQIASVLSVNAQLASSADWHSYIELLTPMAIGLGQQLQLGSPQMRHLVSSLSKYVASPHDGQRVAAVGLFSRLVPLKPTGELAATILLHLGAALSDPNAVVRGLSIQGMGYVGHLSEMEAKRYSETAISALLKGVDDPVGDCRLINIPLESMRGLSGILRALPSERIESFHVSLAIRIRPFLGNYALEMREAAIQLFGDLCEGGSSSCSSSSPTTTSSMEALKEQLLANLFPLLLHLSESEAVIVAACRGTLQRVCRLLPAPRVIEMAEQQLGGEERGVRLNYSSFVLDFVKLIAQELTEHIQDFIDSCLPQLRSQWPEVRGSAAIVIGILHNFLSERNIQTELVASKIAMLLKDEQAAVRVRAATALGYFFGDI